MLLAQIQASAEIAEQMIYGVHDLAHLAQNVSARTITSLAELITAAARGTDTVLARVVGDAQLYSDPRLLRQITSRLCANVAHHSGSPQLEVTIDGDEAAVRCQFDDLGNGISAEKWSQAILPFNRCGKRPTARNVGLGLTVAHQGARSLGGSLAGEQRGEQGFRITLSIPRRFSD